MPGGQRKGKEMNRNRLLNLLGIAAAMAFLVSVGTVGCVPCALFPQPELEVQFWADREVLAPGECTGLHWEVHGGEDYPVFLNDEEVPPFGEEEACVFEPMTFELRVDAPDGPIQQQVTIEVEGEGPSEEPPPGEPPPEEPPPEEPPPGEPPPEEPPPEGGPQAIVFEVHPDMIPQGGCAVLFWEVHPLGEWGVRLDNQEVEHFGERQVCPPGTTTYELLVEGPGGIQERTVTLRVGGEGEPPPPEPTPPPQPTQPGPQPTTPAQPPSGADVRPSDLYLSNQPQGNVWVRVVNNGPATLTNKKVRISGSVTRSTKTIPPTASGHNILPQDYTVNLAPGQQQNINLGYQVDLNQYNYDFTATVAAVDFTDTNTGNNTYSESFQATAPFTVTFAMATIRFENRTVSDTVCFIYARPMGQTHWGPDRLGASTVSSGGKFNFQIQAGTYDLRAENCAKSALSEKLGELVTGSYDWCIGVC